MTKGRCLKIHYPQSLSMAERFVLLHGTKLRIALSVHEYYCDKCKSVINDGYGNPL